MSMVRRLAFALLATASVPAMPGHPVRAAQASPAAAYPRFTVETIGTAGPDVILIPGLATPREVFRPLADALKGKARLHLIELRGFAPGDPGPNARGGAIAGLVEGLADYIAAHKLAHVRIVGHSLGGFAALELAQTHPGGIDGVMIVDALPFAGMIYGGAGATVEMIAPQAGIARDRLLAMAATGEAMPPATQLALSDEGKARITAWTAGVDLPTVAHAMYEDLTTDARPGLPALKVPLTILVPLAGSEAEQEAARRLYESAYAAAPGARIVTLPGSGHLAMLDQPQAFAQAVRGFLFPED